MRFLLPSILLATTACTATHQAAAPESAEALHQRLLTLDTHLDIPEAFGRPNWDFGTRHSYATDLSQVDLGRMEAGKLDGGFFVIYTAQGPVTPEGHAEAKAFGFKRLGEIEAMLAKFPDRIGLATKWSDAAKLNREGKRFAFISMENSYPLGEDLSLLRQFYARGVRMAGPVHFRNNALADSATDQPKWHGFSPLGKQWVGEMNRLGMVIDLSHASDEVLEQAIALSRTPVILSHSGAKAIFDHPRNVSDALLRKLAASGGAICVNSMYMAPSKSVPELRPLMDKAEHATPAELPAIVAQIRAIQAANPPAADFETYMRNVLHVIDVVGVDHTCFGADWDGGGGVPGMEDIDSLPKVTERLRAAGYSEADLQKMWSGNVLRLVRIADERKGG